MKLLLALMMVLVTVAPAGAQESSAEDEKEAKRAVEDLNAQLAKLEDTAGLGGESYTAKLSGNRIFCDFFAQMQKMYPLYKDVTCQARN